MFDDMISCICAAGIVMCAGGLAALGAIWLCECFDNTIRRSRQNLKNLARGDETDGRKTGAGSVLETRLKRIIPDLRLLVQTLKDVPVVRVLIRPFTSRLERHHVEQLRESCLFDLPEMVDILSLALSAGLSFDQAFEWYLDHSDTPLAAEFRRAEQAYQVGMTSRLRALEEVANTLQEEAVLRFVATLRQAFTLGAPLAPALDTLSYETRRYRVSRLEERIAKTPVKLLVPLGACIVPAVLILLMGPIMTQVMSGLQV